MTKQKSYFKSHNRHPIFHPYVGAEVPIVSVWDKIDLIIMIMS